jgi:hypothetical protein
MAAALTQPTRHFDSERERLRRRRDRHARLATDRALTEVAFKLRARERQDRGLALGVGHDLEVHEQIRASKSSIHKGAAVSNGADPYVER